MTTAHRVVGTALVAGAYIATVVVANLASAQWPPLVTGSLLVPAGTLFAGATFTLRDLLHDAVHLPGVVAAIASGAGLSWLVASPRVAVASAVAFAVSELLDTIIYARISPCSRLRAIVRSNVAGLLVDSVLFVPLAFGSVAAIPGQILGKTIATGLTITVLLTVRARRQAVWQ